MSLSRPTSLALAVCLSTLPGCITAGTWESAAEVNESTEPGELQRARLSGDLLDLIVEYPDAGPYLLTVDLTAETLGFHKGQPTLLAQLEGPHPQDLQPNPLPIVEDQRLGEEPDGDDPPLPVLYWSDTYGDGLVLCLRREGAEPSTIRLSDLPPSGAAPMAYVGAVFATPVTFALDVVTFPVQVVMVLVLIDSLEEIFE